MIHLFSFAWHEVDLNRREDNRAGTNSQLPKGVRTAMDSNVTTNINLLCKNGITFLLVIVGILLTAVTAWLIIHSLSGTSGQSSMPGGILLASLALLFVALGVGLQALANGMRSTLMLAAFQTESEAKERDHALKLDIARLQGLSRFSALSISPDRLSLPATALPAQLNAILKDQSGNEFKDAENAIRPKWESSDSAVATVDQSGKVQRVAAGACSVTASFGGFDQIPARLHAPSLKRWLCTQSKNLSYNTAVSSNNFPCLNRSTFSCDASIRSEWPCRIRSAVMRPEAGECMTPWPLKPLTKYKPSTFGEGPMIA